MILVIELSLLSPCEAKTPAKFGGGFVSLQFTLTLNLIYLQKEDDFKKIEIQKQIIALLAQLIQLL